jgi:MSHA pilin protein MshA
MNKPVSGFTLIEMVVAIVILGILAAFAFPHFASQEVEARKAAVNSLGGSVRAATVQAHSMWLYQGNAATITMNGQTITMLNGYPNEASIVNTLHDFTGFQFIDAVVAKFRKIGAASPETCMVTYADAAVDALPVITVVTTGC